MKQDTVAKHPSLVADLLDKPGNFSLVQAMDVASRHLRSRGAVVDAETFRFTINPNLSFPPGDIASLTLFEKPGEPPRVDVMLNLMGLYGASSPLPAYFTEYVAQNQDDPDALREFLDIFNHRLGLILCETWGKYRYFARYQPGARDRLSNRFFGFIGVGLSEVRQSRQLRWPRLMAYMGLIAFSGESAGSLESILRHYFSHPDVTVIPCIRRWVPIPEDQQTRLGVANTRLGEDFILGEEVPDQTGKFRIRIASLGWKKFLSFLPCNDRFAELQTLVKFVLRSRLSFDVELRLKPEEVRPWKLGDDEQLLGWSTWAGEGGAGVVVLETDLMEQ